MFNLVLTSGRWPSGLPFVRRLGGFCNGGSVFLLDVSLVWNNSSGIRLCRFPQLLVLFDFIAVSSINGVYVNVFIVCLV